MKINRFHRFLNGKQKGIFQTRGFTLIEMTMVLVIAGIILSIVATVIPSRIKTSTTNKNQALSERFDNSIQGFLVANHRLPCPDVDGDGIADPMDGTDCSSYVGEVPYLTLALSQAQDPWGNTFRYAVYGAAGAAETDLTNGFTDATDFCNNGLIPASTEIMAGDDGVASATGDNGYNSGKLSTQLTDFSENPVSGTRTGQAYVIVSGGPKDLGGPSGFFDDLNDDSDLEFDAPNKLQTKTYDDLVLAVSVNDLLGAQ